MLGQIQSESPVTMIQLSFERRREARSLKMVGVGRACIDTRLNEIVMWLFGVFPVQCGDSSCLR